MHPGYQGICYPLKCNGSPDSDPLYVSKHDAIQNFTASLNTADWNRQVPVDQLDGDLASGHVPSFGYVIPTECSDQHGDPPFCIDSGNPDGGNLSAADPQDQRLVAQGDAYLGHTVSQITNASFWAKGNNAIVVTHDEGDDNAGCCDAGTSNPNGTGAGQVATVVVTSHGPRHVTYPVPSNHYSLLATVQDSLGLGCLQFTCDTGKVKPLSPLLTVTGAPAVATTEINPPNYATPTPTPVEPQSFTTSTATSGGWSVVPSPLLGTNDNSLGAVAGSSPSDVWAVGNFLPDTATSNQDATLSLRRDDVDGGAQPEWRPELQHPVRRRRRGREGVGGRRRSERRVPGPGPDRVLGRHQVEHRERSPAGIDAQPPVRRLSRVDLRRVGSGRPAGQRRHVRDPDRALGRPHLVRRPVAQPRQERQPPLRGGGGRAG